MKLKFTFIISYLYNGEITSLSQISRLLPPLIKYVSDRHQGLISDSCLYYDDVPYYYAGIFLIISTPPLFHLES